ncbi:hypothetical protein [Xanthomonas theicola]|uniref:hypothetical protein n=1 Tax=Xanthomonas theicola TaxID=56464 RepID=UPI000FF87899|nr:hypothetical protein [Xanthomonas theicola]QNH25100.1 hypothetical protein G4Q83_10580 [Xanthomonas theicola]
MQLLTRIRAEISHSSGAAFNLAMQEKKYHQFAERLISAKNEAAHVALRTARSEKERDSIGSNISKYEIFLNTLSTVRPGAIPKSSAAILRYDGKLPRLKVQKENPNGHEYFLPYNNRAEIIRVTAARQNLI